MFPCCGQEDWRCIKESAEATADLCSAAKRTVDMVEAYCRGVLTPTLTLTLTLTLTPIGGVNWAVKHGLVAGLPIEFSLTNETFDEWTGEDCTSVVRLIGFVMSFG